MTEIPSNPWIYRSSTIIFENPWIRVEEHDVTNPSGGKNLYGKVHFKNQAVGVIPIDNEGNTWLVGQHRYPLNQYSWEIPEGGSPAGEDVVESAARELAEETGLRAGRLELFLHLHTTNSVADEEGYVFIATDLTPGATAFDETEDITVRKLPLKTAIQMAFDGEITDAISLAALFKAAALGYPDTL
ncbi:MAG: NUDIX domain-containing protein [Thiotrichales bacterium]